MGHGSGARGRADALALAAGELRGPARLPCCCSPEGARRTRPALVEWCACAPVAVGGCRHDTEAGLSGFGPDHLQDQRRDRLDYDLGVKALVLHELLIERFVDHQWRKPFVRGGSDVDPR